MHAQWQQHMALWSLWLIDMVDQTNNLLCSWSSSRAVFFVPSSTSWQHWPLAKMTMTQLYRMCMPWDNDCILVQSGESRMCAMDSILLWCIIVCKYVYIMNVRKIHNNNISRAYRPSPWIYRYFAIIKNVCIRFLTENSVIEGFWIFHIFIGFGRDSWTLKKFPG